VLPALARLVAPNEPVSPAPFDVSAAVASGGYRFVAIGHWVREWTGKKLLKTVFLSGGASGLGRAMTLALANNSQRVIIGYSSSQASAEALSSEINAAGYEATHVRTDFGSRGGVDSSWPAITAEFGNPDIVVNNAAIAQEKDYLSVTEDDFETMMRVNCHAPLRLAQLALPSMYEKRWGRIINISSIGGQVGGINQIHYAASKSALISVTRSLARLSAERGVTVNAVAPGLVATAMSSAELSTPAGKAKIEALPTKRSGTPEEIAAAVAFLASEKSSYVVGQTINVNGGAFLG